MTLAARLVREGELEARLTLADHGFACDVITGHVSPRQDETAGSLRECAG